MTAKQRSETIKRLQEKHVKRTKKGGPVYGTRVVIAEAEKFEGAATTPLSGPMLGK